MDTKTSRQPASYQSQTEPPAEPSNDKQVRNPFAKRTGNPTNREKPALLVNPYDYSKKS